MDKISPFAVAMVVIVLSFMGAMAAIIYQNIKNEVKKVDEKVDIVKETYTTKTDFKEYKDDHILDHNKQDRTNEKLEIKIDKILDIVIELKTGGKDEK